MSLTSEFQPTIGALVDLERRNTTRGLTDEERDLWIQHTRRLFGFDQHERRRYFRLHTPFAGRVALDDGTRLDVDVTQLSAGGVGLFSSALTSLGIGDELDLEFGEASKGLAGRTARLRVAWVASKAGALGGQFVDMDPETRGAVIGHLGEHLHLLLTRAEDAFKLFFQHSLDLAALLEGDGRIITISETGAAAFGSTADALFGTNFATLVAPDDAATFTGACERAQLGGRTRLRIDLVDADEGLIAADLAITPFRIEDLRLGCFLAGYDDRERKAAADEIGRLERRLIVSDAMATLGYISAGIVHDVNNPLTFILMHADALQELSSSLTDESRDPDEIRSLLPEIAGDIAIGAQRIADLISELRRFTSLATGDSQYGDLATVVSSVTVMVRNLINHRARFEQTHDPTLGAVALSSGRLTQILLNLLTNATQAFDDSNVEDNVIRLTTRRDGSNVVIEVIDNGRGIPSERRAELLEAFKTTRADAGGTGLGLAIAKDCAESVGGTLHIGDADGGGTHVTVVLPSYDDVAKRATESQKIRIALERMPRVLIVDDEIAILNAYERALKSQFEVVTTTSPAEALLLASRQDYDVLVCDVMIPGISGLDFYDQLSAESPELARRIIFVTGGTMSANERARLASLGNRVILKPVSATALADALWKMVASHHAV